MDSLGLDIIVLPIRGLLKLRVELDSWLKMLCWSGIQLALLIKHFMEYFVYALSIENRNILSF